MKVLRATLWKPDLSTTVSVTRECDLADDVSIDSVTDTMPIDDMLVLSDVFELDDPSFEHATAIAAQRSHRYGETERNMAIMYYYDVAQLRLVRDHGTLAMTEPSPLTVEQITTVLRALAKNPACKPTQTIIGLAADGTAVTLKDGEIR